MAEIQLIDPVDEDFIFENQNTSETELLPTNENVKKPEPNENQPNEKKSLAPAVVDGEESKDRESLKKGDSQQSFDYNPNITIVSSNANNDEGREPCKN